jgi:hypothetical protein
MAYNNKSLPLSERIKALKEDAREKRISQNAKSIALVLGSTRHEQFYKWFDEEMTISYDSYGSNLDISFLGAGVFSIHLGEIDQYRPDIENGKWIEKITAIFNTEVKPLLDARAKQEIEEKKQEIVNRWGLS